MEEISLKTVLPKYKEGFSIAREPSNLSKQYGAKAALPGLSGCPWCDSDMEQPKGSGRIAICVNNEEHIVEWLPWGG